ncbi:hypothetical protein HDU89_003984 [Geranomyces variabilis]|nr:hypothetical protein HDU89_003984 [Geranomyces variabilis]
MDHNEHKHPSGPADSANTIDSPPSYVYPPAAGASLAEQQQHYPHVDDKTMPFASTQQPTYPPYNAQPQQPYPQYNSAYPQQPQQQSFYPPPQAQYQTPGYLPQDGPAPNLVIPIIAAIIMTWVVGPFALCILCCARHPRVQTLVASIVGGMTLFQGIIFLVAGRISQSNCRKYIEQNPGSNTCYYNGWDGGSTVVGDCQQLCSSYASFTLYVGIIWIVLGVLIALGAVFMARRRKMQRV